MNSVPPQVPTDPAREGTCAAWVAEMVLTGECSSAFDLVGQSHPENDWVVEEVMAYHVQRYVMLLRSYGGQLKVERKVTLNEYLEGTPDGHAVIQGDWLRVCDLKYGYVPVEPYRNYQVGTYGAAILRDYPNIRKISIEIYQPRAYHSAGIHRMWEPDWEEFEKFRDEIIWAAVSTQSEFPPLRPGKHCRYCDAALKCPAARSFSYDVHERLLTEDDRRDMTPEELSTELDFLDAAEAILNARKDTIRAEATSRISSEHIPGWFMDQRRGNRRFQKGLEPSVIRAFTGVNPITEKIITPAEAERLGAPSDMIAKLTEHPLTSPKLVKIAPDYYKQLFPKLED